MCFIEVCGLKTKKKPFDFFSIMSPRIYFKEPNCIDFSSCEYDEEITRIDCTESTYSHDASNSSCSKACGPWDSVNTIKSKKTVSTVVDTQSFCNTSTSTDTKILAEDGSQYVYSECSTDTCQMAKPEGSGVRI